MILAWRSILSYCVETLFLLVVDALRDIANTMGSKYWEFDDEKYGNIDWISNIKLDTLQPKSNWQKELNFKITKWLGYDKNDSLIEKSIDKKAFEFPRKSGKIKAEYKAHEE